MQTFHIAGNLTKRIIKESFPVLEGAKPGAIVCLRGEEQVREWNIFGKDIIRFFGLRNIILGKESGAEVTVFIYSESLLKKVLSCRKTLEYLDELGYPSDFDSAVTHLSKKYIPKPFPHEIGIFLGYPICDVCGFIENKGKNFKLCKYWKVYENVEQAIDTFMKIDLSKRNAERFLDFYGNYPIFNK